MDNRKYFNDKDKQDKITLKIIELLNKTNLYDDTDSLHYSLVTKAFEYSMTDMALCVAIRDCDYAIDVYERGQLIIQKTTLDVDEVIYLILEYVVELLSERKAKVPLSENRYTIDKEKYMFEKNKAFHQIGGVFEKIYFEGKLF